MRGKALFILVAILYFSCGQDQASVSLTADATLSKPLFRHLSPEDTGIAFQNILEETYTKNIFLYDYYYNGGGVAVGDFNGDSKEDLYFVGNSVKNKLYLNQGDLNFIDVSAESGAEGKAGFPGGVTTVDINGDGKLDIYICKSGPYNDPSQRQNELYINQGNNKEGQPYFKEEAQRYGLNSTNYSTQAGFFDYDRDGDLDMVEINHSAYFYNDYEIKELINSPSTGQGDKLYQNNQGRFTEVTYKTGIQGTRLGFGLGLTISDVNNDGWMDFFVSNDYSDDDHLYLNQKDGTFTEIAQTSMGHHSLFSMGADAGDINNDGKMDVMTLDMTANTNYGLKVNMSSMDPEQFYNLVGMGLHHQYMYNSLHLNQGNVSSNQEPAFSEIAQLAGVPNTYWSWGPLFFDFNNDGYNDLFIHNGIKKNPRNNDINKIQKARYDSLRRIRAESPQALYEEVIALMPEYPKENFFYVNNGNLTFTQADNNTILGLEPSLSNGAAYADLDGDGDLDLILNNMDSPAQIVENLSTDNGNHLSIQLKGDGMNTMAFGSRVTIELNEETKLVRELNPSRGFMSSSSLKLHFGLGQLNTIPTLIVDWYNGKQSILKNIDSNQTLEINIADASTPKSDLDKAPYYDDQMIPGIVHTHRENQYNDYELESLLPYKLSHGGPCLAVGDVNGDQTDDLFVGGALGQAPTLFLSSKNGYQKQSGDLWDRQAGHEDRGAAFLDVEGDGDLDLYIASGGNERQPNHNKYRDRLLINDGKGNFSLINSALPRLAISTTSPLVLDYDNDGDMDLFVCGEQQPGRYPSPVESYLLENVSTAEKPMFKQEEEPLFKNLGMIHDAAWEDIDGNGSSELLLVGEWMSPRILSYEAESWKEHTAQESLSKSIGWWNCLKAEDVDQDGDLDLIAGNLGTNIKYKASPEFPFSVYLDDFDNSGTDDLVLSYYEEKKEYPLRGRQCTSEQMPFIAEKYKTYDAFAKAEVIDILGKEKISSSQNYAATEFRSGVFLNEGNTYSFLPFPQEAQISSIHTLLPTDVDGDGKIDFICGGNHHQMEVETARLDGHYGQVLLNKGSGRFEVVPLEKSGIHVKGDVRDIVTLNGDNLIFGINDRPMKLFKKN